MLRIHDGLDLGQVPIQFGPVRFARSPEEIDAEQELFGLGQVEYRITDPEAGPEEEPLVRSACPPFIVAPGLKVIVIGPKAAAHRPRLSGLGSLGFFEILAPTGLRIAAMRCRPFFTERTLVVKEVVPTPGGAVEILRKAGAAPEEFPEGTIRTRRGPLFTTRRG